MNEIPWKAIKITYFWLILGTSFEMKVINVTDALGQNPALKTQKVACRSITYMQTVSNVHITFKLILQV